MLSRPDGFILYGKLGVDFFTASELLYPNMTNRLRKIRARANFHMISENQNVSFGIVAFSLYTRRIALKDDCHEKPIEMLAYTSVDFNNMETLAKIFIIPAGQSLYPRNYFQQCSSSSDCNEYKLGIHWILY